MTTPRYIVQATLGKGPAIERQLVEAVAFHCALAEPWAHEATCNALVELCREGVCEMFHAGPPRAYKLTASQRMEVQADRERRAKDATTKKLRAEAPLDRLIRIAKAKLEAERAAK